MRGVVGLPALFHAFSFESDEVRLRGCTVQYFSLRFWPRDLRPAQEADRVKTRAGYDYSTGLVEHHERIALPLHDPSRPLSRRFGSQLPWSFILFLVGIPLDEMNWSFSLSLSLYTTTVTSDTMSPEL